MGAIGKRDTLLKDWNNSSEIGLSEVLRAFHYLAPKTDDTNKAIVEALGLTWEAYDRALEDESGVENRSKAKARLSREHSGLNLESLWQGTPSSGSKRLDAIDQGEPPRLEEGDAFSVDWDAVKELPGTTAPMQPWNLPRMPLFNDRWVRGIMSVIISVPEQLNTLDYKLLEKLSASPSLIERLPYLSRQTLNHGVQLLLDVSESMQPFWKDEAELVVALRRLLDPVNVHIHRFNLELWPERQITWWAGGPELLQEKVPALLVSNFGVGRQRSAPKVGDNESLVGLLKQIKSKKCPVVALVPTDEEQWPVDLKSLIPMSFVWDRPTSPQSVHRRKRP